VDATRVLERLEAVEKFQPVERGGKLIIGQVTVLERTPQDAAHLIDFPIDRSPSALQHWERVTHHRRFLSAGAWSTCRAYDQFHSIGAHVHLTLCAT
jgi:hypothetical protein